MHSKATSANLVVPSIGVSGRKEPSRQRPGALPGVVAGLFPGVMRRTMVRLRPTTRAGGRVYQGFASPLRHVGQLA
jgi:hypothetical protein